MIQRSSIIERRGIRRLGIDSLADLEMTLGRGSISRLRLLDVELIAAVTLPPS